MIMEKKEFKSIFGILTNPARVKVYLISDFYAVMSAKNTNDTYGWFHINAAALEENLKKHGYKWVYQIETVPGNLPFIYLIFGKNLQVEKIKKFYEDNMDPLPDGREMHYEEGSYSSFDIKRYDNTQPTAFEQMIIDKAADVLEIIEP